MGATGPTGATGATGGTEEDSNSTISIDAVRNEKDGVILEEGEIVEDEEENTETKVTSDEEDLKPMDEEDTKPPGDPPLDSTANGVADAEAKQQRGELDTEIEDTQNHSGTPRSIPRLMV